jgi:hypothetical protein
MGNMDKLEEHIRKNREEMDIYKPSSKIWKKIEISAGIKRRRKSRWLSIAAAAAIITGAGLFLFRPATHWSQAINGAKNAGNIQTGNLQLRESEIYYNDLANTIYSQAKPLLLKNPELEKELTSDIAHIDSLCADIRKDLNDNVANQDVIEALICNYRIKIRILEEMLDALKSDDGNSQKKRTNEL